MRRGRHARLLPGLVATLVCSFACTEILGPTPSLTLISSAPPSGIYEAIGERTERMDCASRALLLFGWGDPASHEAALGRLLAETGADVLLNAQIRIDRIWLLLYSRTCATVRGVPARLIRAEAS